MMRVLQLNQPLNNNHDKGIAIIIYIWVYYLVQEKFGQKKNNLHFCMESEDEIWCHH